MNNSALALIVICVTALTPVRAASPGAAETTESDDALYTLGVNLGQQLHDNGVTDVHLRRIEQGIKDALAGKRATGPEQMRLQAYLRAAAVAAAAKNSTAAHAFLSRNASAAGVTTTTSGLQYKIIAPGDPQGASPGPTDQVTVNFRGRLLDGTEFDTSEKPGTLSTIQVNGVMKAWTEALQLMKPGAKWQLFVPPELGYGPMTRAGVPGGSLLIYDLELTKIAPAVARARPGG